MNSYRCANLFSPAAVISVALAEIDVICECQLHNNYWMEAHKMQSTSRTEITAHIMVPRRWLAAADCYNNHVGRCHVGN